MPHAPPLSLLRTMPHVPHLFSRRNAMLAGAICLAAGALGYSGNIQTSSADVQSDRAAAAKIRAAVAAESRLIDSTSDGLQAAERRLAKLSAREQVRRVQFTEAQDELVRARVRLTRLERRSTQAKAALAKNLVANYQTGGPPDLASIVIDADGLSQALEGVEYAQAIHRQNANVLEATRHARGDAVEQETKLQEQETKFQKLAVAAAADRDQANAVRSALLRRQERQLQARAGNKTKLSALRKRISRVESQQLAAARHAADTSTATNEAPRINSSSQGGSVIARVVAAANQIASTPYVWGGGHGGSASGGYDCSGSISYALAAGGLVGAPMTSGGFMSWGESGPGARITVYANAGHMYMVVDGRRYDTSALSSGGTRWSSALRSNAGFVVRHPAGF